MAALMLRFIIQAAKSDGNFDDAEREKLIGQLGDDVDSQEATFVQAEMKAPFDVDALVAQVPNGLGPQVYAMSVIAINLDSQLEAQYLHKLAQGLRLSVDTINDVHAQLGVPSLYA
ncbi:tellurite resistance TerB family protein [Ascidiaceihabitans sp.]|nr:tellurite resistance TerB family protein [Ascidiaceihabitans sp.]